MSTVSYTETRFKHNDYSAAPALTELRALPDGVLPVGDWLDAMIARGWGWSATIGAFSTPITGGGAGTVLDQDQPEGIISVPSGYAMRPVRIHVQCQTPLIANDADESEILIALDRAAAYDGSGTVTDENGTTYNMRTDLTTGSPVRVFSAATANITNPTLGVELARAVVTGDVQGTAANALWGKLDLLYEPRHPPIIVGPACVYLYWGGTVATTGFAQIQFVAFPASKVTGLS